MKAAERKNLIPHLQRTVDAIEDILRSGLTTANESTIKTLGITFQEASRLKLLRLGSTLRGTHQEISRYVEDHPDFSSTRLAFFLNRSWLLCKGLQHSIEEKNQELLDQLLWTPPATKSRKLDLICLGVVKKVAADNFCAFEFRFREFKTEQAYTWSAVFPLKKGTKIPAEGYLHLPQKQKFHPKSFLDGKVIQFQNVLVSNTQSAAKRIQLSEKSQVEIGDSVEDWATWLTWDPAKALQRIEQHEISPFDVDIELQEEVVFRDYRLLEAEATDNPNQTIIPLVVSDSRFDLVVSNSVEGKPSLQALKDESKLSHPRPLYGVMYYSNAQLLALPLTIYDEQEDRMNYITISSDSIDKKALLSAMKFT